MNETKILCSHRIGLEDDWPCITKPGPVIVPEPIIAPPEEINEKEVRWQHAISIVNNRRAVTAVYPDVRYFFENDQVVVRTRISDQDIYLVPNSLWPRGQ